MKNVGADQKTKADFSRFIISTLLDQIKQADTKAFGIMGVIGILIVALLSRLNEIKSASTISPLWIFYFAISALVIILALKSVILVVYPRTSKKTSDGLFYFKDIISSSQADYLKKSLSLSSEEIITESYSNGYNLALIANSKFKALRQAFIITLISFILTVIILFIS